MISEQATRNHKSSENRQQTVNYLQSPTLAVGRRIAYVEAKK
jgi:hypothetical protein